MFAGVAGVLHPAGIWRPSSFPVLSLRMSKEFQYAKIEQILYQNFEEP
jgi:hypothetical protein